MIRARGCGIAVAIGIMSAVVARTALGQTVTLSVPNVCADPGATGGAGGGSGGAGGGTAGGGGAGGAGAANASGPPRNGTCTASNPALSLSFSTLRCVPEPTPIEA